MKALDRLEVMKALGISDWAQLEPFKDVLGIKDLSNEAAVVAAVKRQFAELRPGEKKRTEREPASSLFSSDELNEKKRTAQYPALLWLETKADASRQLADTWTRVEGRALDLLLKLVNSGDSLEELKAFRKQIPTRPEPWDIAGLSNHELCALRDDVRCFWEQLQVERQPGTGRQGVSGSFGDSSKVSLILHKLWHGRGSDYLSSDDYWISWETGTFFPRQKNFRGVVARILFKECCYLAKCPSCHRYFIKRRDDQKNCLRAECRRRANNERQQRFQQRQKNPAVAKFRR